MDFDPAAMPKDSCVVVMTDLATQPSAVKGSFSLTAAWAKAQGQLSIFSLALDRCPKLPKLGLQSSALDILEAAPKVKCKCT